MNYYPFHVGDYTLSTAHLEPMEDLAYRRLIDIYYAKDGQLFGDVADIARLIRMRSNLVEVEQVINEFFTRNDENKLCHSRCDEEINKAIEKSVKAKASAEASVNSRKANAIPKTSECSTNAQRTLNERSAIQEPITNNQEPISKDREIQSASAHVADATTPTTKKQTSAKPDFAEKPETISDALWTEWLHIRKTKKQPLPTPRAMQSMAEEASKAGLDIVQAITECCDRGWAGFKADWYENSKASTTRPVAESNQKMFDQSGNVVTMRQPQPQSKMLQGVAALQAMKSANRGAQS